MRMEQLEEPAKTIMFGDTRQSGNGRHTDQNLDFVTVHAYHGEFTNVSFFDGHVEAVEVEKIKAIRPATEEGSIFWNGYYR